MNEESSARVMIDADSSRPAIIAASISVNSARTFDASYYPFLTGRGCIGALQDGRHSGRT